MEKSRVELLDTLKVSAEARHDPARRRRRLRIKPVYVHAGWRDFTHSIPTFTQHLPVGIRRIRAAGKAAGHPDDCY